MASPDRAAEAARLYDEMGFEVRMDPLEPAELDPRCGACAETICSAYVVLYTRRRTEGEP